MAKCKDYKEKLKGYINELGRWGQNKVLWKPDEGRIRAYLYTDGHVYAIDATETGYLGCVVSCRKPRPGEDWTRGSDLADGRLNDKTWNLILRDIIAYELKTLSDYILNPPAEMYEGEEKDEVRATG